LRTSRGFSFPSPRIARDVAMIPGAYSRPRRDRPFRAITGKKNGRRVVARSFEPGNVPLRRFIRSAVPAPCQRTVASTAYLQVSPEFVIVIVPVKAVLEIVKLAAMF
jgi:hypothetical protein